jgi:hypothetical protein
MTVLNLKISTSWNLLSNNDYDNSYDDGNSEHRGLSMRTKMTTRSGPSSSSSSSSSSLIPQHVLDEHAELMQKARDYLEKGDHPCPSSYGARYDRRGFKCEQDNFKDMVVSLPLRDYQMKLQQQNKKENRHELLYHKFVGKYKEVKGMLHPRLAFPNKGECVVYGMGIHDDSKFEQYMTTHCDHVHAFDCTVDVDKIAVKGKPFTFHQICIGSATGIDVVSSYGNNQRSLMFKPLAQVMEELGHDYIDLLKFDIEGSEWELFEKEILELPQSKLPKQILFELHTAKANPNFVPPKSVEGRDRAAVNRLMLRLFDVGYRIIEQERNDGDPYCTEISMVRI